MQNQDSPSKKATKKIELVKDYHEKISQTSAKK